MHPAQRTASTALRARCAAAFALAGLVGALCASADRVTAQPLSTRTIDRDTHDEIVGGGAWHVRSVPCVDGVVDDVGPRLANPGQRVFTAADYRASGVEVHVRFVHAVTLLPGIVRRDASVVHYQDDFDNALMQRERRGDRVQACLLSFPTPTYDTRTKQFICDPDRDPRGWWFRVYDYRRRAAYFGPDSEHSCGGA
ncbi:MAG TPA: hypothetical protein VFB22_05410 [Candidatus Baltobacteraceae bacterium]|nr:hypothetical protein [Candidatus Baltobacteraceae bacterium]